MSIRPALSVECFSRRLDRNGGTVRGVVKRCTERPVTAARSQQAMIVESVEHGFHFPQVRRTSGSVPSHAGRHEIIAQSVNFMTASRTRKRFTGPSQKQNCRQIAGWCAFELGIRTARLPARAVATIGCSTLRISPTISASGLGSRRKIRDGLSRCGSCVRPAMRCSTASGIHPQNSV